MTLHEAMVEVLRAHGRGWMDRDEIAREIARRDLFRRPSDGRHPPSDQLRLRALKSEYRHLFECSDSRCSKIRLQLGSEKSTASPQARLSAITRGKQHPKGAVSASPRPHRSDSWYEELRESYRPKKLRYLLIAESPPDPGAGQRRFFFSPNLAVDNLYRGVVEAVYGGPEFVELRDKTAVLARLREDGFWLIDAVEYPVNKLATTARVRAIQQSVPRLIERCMHLAPERGTIICHGGVYAAVAQGLRDAGVSVLHTEALPFPLGNWRRRFIEGFRQALRE